MLKITKQLWTEHTRTHMCTSNPQSRFAGARKKRNVTIRLVSQRLARRSARFFAHLIRKSDEDPTRSVALHDGGVAAKQPDRRRVGRPRGKWHENATQAMW